MSDFISKLGDILHLHPLAHHPVAPGTRQFHDGSSPVTTSISSSSKDDLAPSEHEPSNTRGDLGQSGLPSGDEPDEDRDESIWLSLD